MQSKEQRRKTRLLKKIQSALKNYRCQFITLSFNDEILRKTSEKTRERYIKDYLNNETAFYIANKDYGAIGKREHYHAFIIACTIETKSINKALRKYKNQINFKAYQYGNIKADFVATKWRKQGDKDYQLTAQDITNHFYKDTAKNSRIIQSRKIPTYKEQIDRIKRLVLSR